MVELPENQCRQHGSDYGWRGPSQLSIWKEVDRASQKVIAYHTHLVRLRRGADYLDGRPSASARLRAAHLGGIFDRDTGKATFWS